MAKSNLIAEFLPKEVNMRNFTAPYVFREYPKWVTLADGSQMVVNDADEEFAAVGEKEKVNPVDSIERDALLTQAKDLGLKPHHKMSNQTLQRLIDESQS